MEEHRFAEIERNLARCRVILSVTAFVAIYVAPTRPTFTRLVPLTGGPFMLDPLALAVMLAHLGYSILVYLVVARRLVSAEWVRSVTTCADVLFGTSIALVTEGANSPYYVFFTFAVLVAGFRAGMRLAVTVTVTSVALYLGLILASRPEGLNFYIMRPAYLGITGYLVGYLGQQRLALESRLRAFETATQRQRIARSLHDDYVQALSAFNMRTQISRELLRQGRIDEALAELGELQASVNREHDELRTYIRTLADLDVTPLPGPVDSATRFAVRAQFDGSLRTVEHALQIMLEGVRNVGRHARAGSAVIEAEWSADRLCITIDDDGVGFPADAGPPWSIASRAAEVGGEVRVGGQGAPGGHVEIELPEV